MPEPTPEGAAGVLALQRSLAHLAFAADADGMERDPVAFARSQGLPPQDQAAFLKFKDRLLVYRDFIRNNLAEPLEEAFPISIRLLENAGAWAACFDGFLEVRAVQSVYYRDVAPTFLGWLASTAWGQDRWPYLLQLAHCEILQILVVHHPGGAAPAGLARKARPEDRLVLNPTAQVVHYDYAVHLASLDHPEPAPGSVNLLVFQDPEGKVFWKELTPATAALLQGAQTRPISETARALGVLDPGEALGLLEELCGQGAIAGFIPVDPR